MQRSDWKPVKPSNVYISKRVMEIINKISGTDLHLYDSNYLSYIIDYAYNMIDISLSNPLKLSGIGINVYESLCWENILNLYPHIDSITDEREIERIIEKLNNYYSDLWNNNYYQSTVIDLREEKGTYVKISKLIAAFLPDVSQDHLSTLTGKFVECLRMKSDLDISIVKISDNPSEVYTLNSYHINSCMKEKQPDFFKIYDELKDTKIAYVYENETLLARALLHDKAYMDKTEIKLMDRIYFANDDELARMKIWAKEHGYWTKKDQSINCYDCIDPDGNTYFDKHFILECPEIDDQKYESVPYFDTFCYYYRTSSFLSSSEQIIDIGWADTNLRNTDGTDYNYLFTERRKYCYECDSVISSDYTPIEINGRLYCQHCIDTYFFTCPDCGMLRKKMNHQVITTPTGHYICTACAYKKVREMEANFSPEYTDYIFKVKIGGIYYINKVLDNFFTVCSKCGDYIWKADMHGDMCNDCYNYEERPRRECNKEQGEPSEPIIYPEDRIAVELPVRIINTRGTFGRHTTLIDTEPDGIRETPDRPIHVYQQAPMPGLREAWNRLDPSTLTLRNVDPLPTPNFEIVSERIAPDQIIEDREQLNNQEDVSLSPALENFITLNECVIPQSLYGAFSNREDEASYNMYCEAERMFRDMLIQSTPNIQNPGDLREQEIINSTPEE